MRIPRRARLLVVLWLFPVAAPALQYEMRALYGTVQTAAGRPVRGAVVRASGDGEIVSQETDAAGRFAFYFSRSDACTLRFEHPSAAEIGTYQVRGSFLPALELRIVLDCGGANPSSAGCWHVHVRGREDVSPFPPESVLTADRIESMPETGHLWSLLNHVEPSVVTDRFDIGGMHSHRQFLFGVRGSSWSQNQATVNGLTVTDPAGEGFLQIPDVSALAAIVYTVGDSSARHAGPGGHLTLIPKTGGSALHGQAHTFVQAGALQNVNPTARHRFFRITESDERWRHFINGGFQLGGPLRRRWTYFGSLSVRDLEKRIRNHPLPVSAALGQGTLSLARRLSAGDRLGIYWAGQRLRDPQAGASPQVTRAASLDERRSHQLLQGTWTRRISPAALLNLRLGAAVGSVSARLQPGTRRQSREDLYPGFALFGAAGQPDPWGMVALLSNTRRDAAPLAGSSRAVSWESAADYSAIFGGVRRSAHRISAGVGWRRMTRAQSAEAFDNVNLLFFEGAPDSVRLLDAPARAREGVTQVELHASDDWSLGRLGVAAGLYADIVQGANLLYAGGRANERRWASLSGRLGIACQVTRRYPLVLRAGAARILHQPLTSTWAAVNPEGLRFRLYAWNDADGDEQYRPGENVKLLKVYGPGYSRPAANLAIPRTAEITLGLAQEGPGGLAFRAVGFRRFDHRLMSLVNVGVPFSSYEPVEVIDPGPDGDLGAGGDDRLITVFNQKAETLGQDRYLLANPEGHGAHAEGYQLRLSFSRARLQAEAAVTRYRAIASTAPGIAAQDNDSATLLGVYDNPNNAALARGSTFFDRGTTGRLWVAANLGRGVRCSLIASYQDGLPYGRYLPVKGLNQGVVAVLTRRRGPGEPGSQGGFMTTHNRTIDLRIARDFRHAGGRWRASLDIFNLANSALSLVQTDVTAPTHLWRIPLRFQTPRSLQLGMRYEW